MRLITTFFVLLFSFVPAGAVPHLTIDLDSGRVLSHEQAFDPWHPASLTKLMTAYVAFRAIEAGQVTTKSPVRMSRNARRQPPSRMGYDPGTVLNLENALALVIVKSANDVSVAIAESISGSVAGFAQRMNAEARRLGMTGSRFVNPHGLHDRRQVTTARDMALLVRALHTEFPQYSSLFATALVRAPTRTKKGKVIQRDYYSYNLLLERFRGADGFKTGFVCASGYNLIGSASRSGRRLAAIVLGRESQVDRAVSAAKLLTQGFQLPVGAGEAIDLLKPHSAVPKSARNMRSTLCTKKARAKRYEPGAGLAVVDSPWLGKRVITAKPLQIVLGEASGPSLAHLAPPGRIAVPKPRPVFAAAKLIDGVATAGTIGTPLPNFRPSMAVSQ